MSICNGTGFGLLFTGIACLVWGFHSGDAALSKVGEGLIPSALLALHIIPKASPADPAASPK